MTADEVNGIDRVEQLLAAEADYELVAERLDPRVEAGYRAARQERAAVAELYGSRSGTVTPLGATPSTSDLPAVTSSREA